MANDNFEKAVREKTETTLVVAPIIFGAIVAYHGNLDGIWGITKIIIGIVMVLSGIAYAGLLLMKR